jgi:hypothetical protein
VDSVLTFDEMKRVKTVEKSKSLESRVYIREGYMCRRFLKSNKKKAHPGDDNDQGRL